MFGRWLPPCCRDQLASAILASSRSPLVPAPPGPSQCRRFVQNSAATHTVKAHDKTRMLLYGVRNVWPVPAPARPHRASTKPAVASRQSRAWQGYATVNTARRGQRGPAGPKLSLCPSLNSPGRIWEERCGCGAWQPGTTKMVELFQWVEDHRSQGGQARLRQRFSVPNDDYGRPAALATTSKAGQAV